VLRSGTVSSHSGHDRLILRRAGDAHGYHADAAVDGPLWLDEDELGCRDHDGFAQHMTEEELVVEFALTRLDHPGVELEEIAAMLVRRVGPEQMLSFASQNLAARDELRAAAFESAVEFVLRTILTLRDDGD
jgi:hypothetical protein